MILMKDETAILKGSNFGFQRKSNNKHTKTNEIFSQKNRMEAWKTHLLYISLIVCCELVFFSYKLRPYDTPVKSMCLGGVLLPTAGLAIINHINRLRGNPQEIAGVPYDQGNQ